MQTLSAGRGLLAHTDITKTLVGGALAALAMTAVVYLGPLIGIPNVDFAAMLGSLISADPPTMFTPNWWVGLAWHLVNGAVLFSFIYAWGVRAFIPAHPIVRGAAWSLVLWLLCQAMAMPIVGGGFFSGATSDPTEVVLGSLLAHLVYGIVLGASVGDERLALPGSNELVTGVTEETRSDRAA